MAVLRKFQYKQCIYILTFLRFEKSSKNTEKLKKKNKKKQTNSPLLDALEYKCFRLQTSQKS